MALRQAENEQKNARIASSVASAVNDVLVVGEVVQQAGNAAQNLAELIWVAVYPIQLTLDPGKGVRTAQTILESINGVTDIPLDLANLLFQLTEYVSNNDQFFNPTVTTIADPSLPARALKNLLIIPEPRIDLNYYDWSRDALVSRGPIEHSLTKIGGSILITEGFGIVLRAGQAGRVASLGPNMLLNALEKAEPQER